MPVVVPALIREAMQRPVRAAALGLCAVAAAVVFLANTWGNPPGFAMDESGIAYNAWRLASTGADMNGEPWPVYTTFAGGAMNMPYVYVLSAVFALTGPSIEVARVVSGVLGLAGGMAIGLLAGRMSGRWWVGSLMAAAALTSPWLFENSRLVFEVAIYPLTLGLLLLAVWRAARHGAWTIGDIVAIAGALALVTYGYSVGRLFGPLLAASLVVFWSGRRRFSVAGTWAIYGLLLMPMLLFALLRPGWLTGRFQELTYVSAAGSIWTAAGEVAKHYLSVLNPAQLLLVGETGNHRHHVADVTGSVPLVVVALAVLGAIWIVQNQLSAPFWRWLLIGLVLSPLPSALTNDSFHSLRLVPFFVFLTAVAGYGMTVLARRAMEGRGWRIVAIAVLAVGAMQAGYFMIRYHQVGLGPERHAWFDSGVPTLVRTAMESGDVINVHDGRAPAHLHALWYGALFGVDERLRFVSDPASLDAGAVVLTGDESCERCEVLGRDSIFMLYRRTE